MKTKILGVIVILLILNGSFSSCNKENFADYNSEKFRLSKILKYSNSSATKLTGETVYAYDEVGNMVKESFYDCNPTPILERYNEYEYLGNKKSKMKIFDGVAGNPTLGSYYEYKYEGTQLVKEELYCGRGCNGSLISSRNYDYDERGNLIKEDNYDHRYYGLLGSLKYVYDSQNKLITVLTTDGVLDFYLCQKYEYDSEGREVKLEYYEYEGLSGYVEKFYNGTSKLPEKELHYNKNGNQTRKYQHYYDSFENLTETVINDECSMFKRKYDGKLLIEEIYYCWHEYGHWGTGQMPESGMSRYEYTEL